MVAVFIPGVKHSLSLGTLRGHRVRGRGTSALDPGTAVAWDLAIGRSRCGNTAVLIIVTWGCECQGTVWRCYRLWRFCGVLLEVEMRWVCMEVLWLHVDAGAEVLPARL